MPQELLENITDRFEIGSGDARSLGATNKALRQPLRQRILADHIVAVANFHNTLAHNGAPLVEALEDGRTLPAPLQLKLIRYFCSNLSTFLAGNQALGDGLTALRQAILALPTIEQRAEAAQLLATEFSSGSFLNIDNEAPEESLPTRVDHFYQDFLADIEQLPTTLRGRIKAMAAGGLHLLGRREQRLQTWSALAQDTDAALAAHRPLLLQQLTTMAGFLPEHEKNAALAHVLQAIGQLPVDDRACLLSELYCAACSLSDPAAQLSWINCAIEGAKRLAGEDRCLVATDMLDNLYVMAPENQATAYRNLMDLLSTVPSDAYFDATNMIAGTVGNLPGPHLRFHLQWDMFNQLPALSAQQRCDLMPTLIDNLYHLQHHPQLMPMYGALVRAIDLLPPASATYAACCLSTTIPALPADATRDQAFRDLLLEASLRPPTEQLPRLCVLSNHISDLQGNASQYDALFWLLRRAACLPDTEHAELLVHMTHRVFQEAVWPHDARTLQKIASDTASLSPSAGERVHRALLDDLHALGKSIDQGFDGGRDAALQLQGFEQILMVARLWPTLGPQLGLVAVSLANKAESMQLPYGRTLLERYQSGFSADVLAWTAEQLRRANHIAARPAPTD